MSAALAVQRFWSRLVRQASILNTPTLNITQGRSHTPTVEMVEEEEEEVVVEEEDLSILDHSPDSFISSCNPAPSFCQQTTINTK